MKNFPQGLKPAAHRPFCGTAEAMPFQNSIYATSIVTAWFGGFPGLKIETGGTQVRGLAYEIIKSQH
jgi:hypothetical protein